MTSHHQESLTTSLLSVLVCLLLVICAFHAVLSPSRVLVVLEFISVAVLFITFWSGVYKRQTYPWVFIYVFIALILSIIYIVPLSFFQVLNDLSFPGRELYAETQQWLGDYAGNYSYQYLSIIPYETMLTLLALIPLLAVFFAIISLPEVKVRNIVYLVIIMATVQAVVGVVQYTSGNSAFYFGLNSGSATGLFANRDHFAGMLAMLLPMCIGLLLFSFGGATNTRKSNAQTFINMTLLFAFAAIMIFLAAVFTKSRAGVFLIMLAVLISSVVFSRHIGGKQAVGFTAAFSTVAIGLAASIGLIPVLNRFVQRNPVDDERFEIFKHTIEGIKSFFPIGSGPGTYPDIYRAFQPIDQLKFVNNAHNDYLELVFEMGVIGVFIIVTFFLCYLLGWFKLRNRKWDQGHFIQIGAGIGMFLILLHCSVDFIFHEPMNSMIFAILAGIFFKNNRRDTAYG